MRERAPERPGKEESDEQAGAGRRVRALGRIVFVPGWDVPVHTMSVRSGVWAKEVSTFGKDRFRHFTMRSSGPDIFGPHHVSFICGLPEAGR